jgi:hypothetical protein
VVTVVSTVAEVHATKAATLLSWAFGPACAGTTRVLDWCLPSLRALELQPLWIALHAAGAVAWFISMILSAPWRQGALCWVVTAYWSLLIGTFVTLLAFDVLPLRAQSALFSSLPLLDAALLVLVAASMPLAFREARRLRRESPP